MKVITNKKKIDEVLERGVENIYPSRKEVEKVLLSGKKLKIYTGIDPTGNLHIGHGAVLRKLRQLQDLGHEVIVLIGDFTARIGDPTDKKATRKRLTKEQVKKNSANYKKLVGKILDVKKSNLKFLHNEKWTNKLKPEDMLELASNFTVSRLLERDMFQKRIKEGKQIYLHEFLYPIFQAYDAASMDVDMQVGGNDQTFNMLAGRTLVRKTKGKEKFVLTTKLLVDPTGKKMGKTEGNVMELDEKPESMYGKIMSWPDGALAIGFEVCTDLNFDKKKKPMDEKMRLAHEIVKIYHGKKNADKAAIIFTKTFQKKEIPKDIKEATVKKGNRLDKILVSNSLVSSNSEFRRLIKSGAISFDGEKINDPNYKIEKSGVVKVGKRRFLKIKIK